MEDDPLRVMVVDDSVVYRRAVAELLSSVPGVEVVGAAANGRIALSKLELLRPHLLTLDVEMPEVDGLQVLEALSQRDGDVGAIMLSAFTSDGARATMQALRRGAFDFVLKPSCDDFQDSLAELRGSLVPKIEAFARTRRARLQGAATIRSEKEPAAASVRFQPSPASDVGPPSFRSQAADERVVALGISTGGPVALSRMLPKLPADLPAAVLLVQHMPPLFTRSLAEDLNRSCPMTVQEAADGDPVQAGNIYIAPGGRQMKVENGDAGVAIRITDDPPEQSCRPSVDYLFRSVAQVYGGRAVGVIMTGMGYDGTLGCKLLKRKGAAIIAQNAETCVVFGMPKRPIEEGVADVVAGLDDIAECIVADVSRRTLPCR